MCVPILSKPKAPSIPKPTPITEPPKPVDPDRQQARDEQRIRARRAAGRESTLLTSALGLNRQASIRKKSLLGE